jgi:peptidylprolyl isomerase
MDGAIGVIRTVTGGRTLVDFNHPLSGKEVTYDVKVKRMVTDRQEQAEAYLDMTLRIKDKKITITDKKATIKTKIALPEELQKSLADKMKPIFGLDDLAFEVEKDEKKSGTPKKEETEADTPDEE